MFSVSFSTNFFKNIFIVSSNVEEDVKANVAIKNAIDETPIAAHPKGLVKPKRKSRTPPPTDKTFVAVFIAN